MMNKKMLRSQQIKRIKAFAETEEKRREDRLLLHQLLNSKRFNDAQSIGLTASLSYEVDTAAVIAHLWDQGKLVYLARVNAVSHLLEFVSYNYTTPLKVSKFGVEEVADSTAQVDNNVDFLLVPGLAFSKEGHARLGFGGGYYDRFLAQHHPLTASLVNSQMLFETPQWPVERYDVAIDHLFTV